MNPKNRQHMLNPSDAESLGSSHRLSGRQGVFALPPFVILRKSAVERRAPSPVHPSSAPHPNVVPFAVGACPEPRVRPFSLFEKGPSRTSQGRDSTAVARAGNCRYFEPKACRDGACPVSGDPLSWALHFSAEVCTLRKGTKPVGGRLL
jgi:hypothetical protein